VGAPADAIREFVRELVKLPIVAQSSHVKDDIAELRRAYPQDDEFAQALRSVTRRLRNLRPDEGSELDHELDGWWRVKFSSGIDEQRADLRIIFRPTKDGFELRAFGHRHDPASIYFRSLARRSRGR
jgi:mRNA-degrading endonuclease YafQ of YafQ-DinJ toxin-antitoxin module